VDNKLFYEHNGSKYGCCFKTSFRHQNTFYHVFVAPSPLATPYCSTDLYIDYRNDEPFLDSLHYDIDRVIEEIAKLGKMVLSYSNIPPSGLLSSSNPEFMDLIEIVNVEEMVRAIVEEKPWKEVISHYQTIPIGFSDLDQKLLERYYIDYEGSTTVDGFFMFGSIYLKEVGYRILIKPFSITTFVDAETEICGIPKRSEVTKITTKYRKSGKVKSVKVKYEE
jgi:hypothetical protein